MIDKNVLRENLILHLLANGLIRESLEQRRLIGMTAIESFQAERKWHELFDVLINTMVQVIEQLEIAGR